LKFQKKTNCDPSTFEINNIELREESKIPELDSTQS